MEGPLATDSLELLRGSLDVIVLRALSWHPMHGLALARWLREVTGDALQLEEGTLYPALYRMEERGWLASAWRLTENNRRARYYRLTPLGRRRLAVELRSWDRFVRTVTRVFEAKPSTASA